MTYSVTWLDAETAKVIWDHPDPIELTYSRVTETIRADAVTAVMEITTTIADIGWVAGPQRINLLSSSGMDALRRTCQNRTDIPDWALVLGHSTKAVLDHYLSNIATADVDLSTRSVPPSWLLPPLLESEGFTVIYARGGSGKSYLACACALTVATGIPLVGEPTRIGPVAYLDWESNAGTLNDRIQRLCRGADIGSLPHPIRHFAMSGPFAARRAQIAPYLTALNPALIIVDSKGLATTGAPESSEGILDLARALRYLPAPVLLIDHISKGAIKGDDPDMAYGSQYVEASARLAWSVKTDATPGAMRLRLHNTKANNHARARDIHLELVFAGDGVAILESGAPQVAEDLPKHAAAISEYLSDHGPAGVSQISGALDINKGTVHRILKNTPGFTLRDDQWTVFVAPTEIPF